MKAYETYFQKIIEGTNQYMVPLFQRPYKWTKVEWETLWEDLFGLIESESSKNLFIGSIVTIPIDNAPQGIDKYTLIDGQQRLTTISILLAVLRNLAIQESNNELYLATQQLNKKLAAKINDMLINRHYEKKDDEYLKLLPTQVDRDAFKQLIEESEGDQNSNTNQIAKCYNFFSSKLKLALKLKNDTRIDLQQLYLIIINKLSIVNIVIDSEDNPYIVFESLNAKSRSLTQADLIRNYFFMLIPAKEQQQYHADYWLPMQEQLQDTLTDFVRHYIMSFGKIVVQKEIYSTLKDEIKDKIRHNSNVLTELVRLSKFAKYYHKIIKLEVETNQEIRQALHRLNQIEITTAYPFLLKCYDDYEFGKLTSDDFKSILHKVENFILRRFVCNIPSKELDKIFPFLYREAEAKAKDKSLSLINGVSLVLQQKGYPSDDEFRCKLANAKFYVRGQKIRTGLILKSIECAYANKEPTDLNSSNLTIEHILPQNIANTEWWQQHLGENWQTTHELYLHTLGNLTLIEGNSELPNVDFTAKKKRLQNSDLAINNYFTTVSTWTQEDIEQRSEALAELVLKIWPYFGDTSIDPSDVTRKKPIRLQFMDIDITPKTWGEVLINTLNKINEIEPEDFITLVANCSSILSKEPFHLRRPSPLSNGYYVETNLSAKNVHKFCIQAIEAVGISSEKWNLTFE